MRLVCVTGMHRSGTSMVTRMLNLLGFELGDETELLGPAPDNPKGFWEHREVKALNDRVLAKLGGRWDAPPNFDPGWENRQDLEPVRSDAAALASELPDAPVAWKDPRLSLTLPFWRTVTQIERTVLCLRDPLEVAGSLGTRNGTAPAKAAELWVTYTLSAWANDPQRIVLSYPDALADPVGASRQLAELLGLTPPDGSTLEAIRSFAEPDLRHHRDVTSFDGRTMRLAVTIHDVLTGDRTEHLAPILQALNRSWQALGNLDEPSSRIAELQEELETSHRERGALQEAVSRRDAELERMTERHQAQLDEVRERQGTLLERRDAAIRRREVQLELTNARIERFQIEIDDLQRAADERDVLRDRLEVQEGHLAKLEGVNEDLEILRASNREMKQELHELERDRRDLDRRLRRLRNRRIVRLGLALAEIFRPVFRVVRKVRSRVAAPSDRQTARDEGGGGTANTDEDDEGTAAGETGEPRSAPQPGVHAPTDWTLAALRSLGTVTVIVPVHNALQDLRRCLDSVVRNSTGRAELLLIDDASTDPDVRTFLERASSRPNVRTLRNDENLGFTATVNRGLRESEGDVILLNSDTEVGPRWIENLALAAYRSDDIATATAISNNAGAFSVPDIGQRNEVPSNLTKDQVARLVMQTAQRIAPETPTGNGFCMYIKRSVLNEIGPFDAQAFPRGYGEENDFCMRALRAGYRHVVDDATFVFHVREASFGTEKASLAANGREVVNARFPDYTDRVRAFVRSDPLHAVQDRIRRAFAEAREGGLDVRPRALYVIHAGMGGAPQTNEDLVGELDSSYKCFVLTSDTRRLVLYRYENASFEEVRRFEFDVPVEVGEFSREDYRRFVSAVLIDHAIEILHVRHLIKHTFDAPQVAADLGIPVVVSFHDFYLSCPTVHLLDNEDRFCGGTCTPGSGRCRLPNDWLARAPEPLKHGWVHTWREHVQPVLERADALVTTTDSPREVYLRSFPEVSAARFEVIEHGRDLDLQRIRTPAPVPGGPIRILVPGNLDVHKGASFIRLLRDLDDAGRLEFHLLGRVEEPYRELGEYHGTYERDEFAARAEEIAPAFVGLFSICAETYSHTLTEAWSCGLPVIASDLGALGERISRHGRGWTVDVTDPVGAYQRILDIADDAGEYWRVRSEVTTEDLPTVAEMAHRYDLLYRSLLDDRRRFRELGSDGSDERVLDVRLLVVPGGDPGTFPGSVHVRTLSRYRHPALRNHLAATVADLDGLVLERTPPPDLVYVQRNAVPTDRVEDLLDTCRDHDLPLIVDLDDNLLDVDQLPAGDPQWRGSAPGVQHLVSAADLVTVSTPTLEEAVRNWSDRTAVVPNHLDGRLWFTPRPSPSPVDGPVRILYMGTRTHDRDLDVLRRAVTRLDADPEIRFEVEVIGGEAPGPVQDWYTRIPIPSGCSEYPRFVSWLKSQAHRWHIGVAPLADTEFNRYKSDLKFLEYSALGLAGAYSAVPAYATSVQDEHTGLLVDGSVEGWVHAIRRLALDADLRTRLREASWRYVRTERSLEAHAGELVELLRATAHRRRTPHVAA